MSRVFVPQVPSRFDTKLNTWMPTVNIDPAREYGDVKVMLPPEAARLETATQVKLLKDAMVDYGPEDYILAIGNPVIIAITAAIADRASSPLRILQWDKVTRRYQLLQAEIDEDAEMPT